MWVGYDDVTLALIPHNAPVVFAYEDGDFRNLALARRAFPHAHVFSICVNAAHDGDFLDVERGDADPSQLKEWWLRQHERGVWRPGPYASIGNGMPQCEEIMRTLATRDEYRLWSADYTHEPHINPGMDGTQWTDRALGRSLDESLLRSDFVRSAPPAQHPRMAAEVEFDTVTRQWRVAPLPLDAPPLR